MIGRSIDHSVDWLDLHPIDSDLAQTDGNELRLVGLHYFGIPTLFEYTPTITPFFYALTSRLLTLPGDKQMRSVIVLRKIEPRILKMLGVRFVITDREYDGPATLRVSSSDQDRTLYLYELNHPNLGNYSPTAVRDIATATDIVARIGDPSFDPTREVIGNVPGDMAGLLPAKNARLSLSAGALTLHAESNGKSILVLPLEFSRCLEAKVTGSEQPLLFRANLLETGVLFSGRLDAALSLQTGAFLHPACRLWDLFDARALRVEKVPPNVTEARVSGD